MFIFVIEIFSSTEDEYMALTKVVKEAIWERGFEASIMMHSSEKK